MKVKDLLTDESKWLKVDLARNHRGESCSPDDVHAVAFCLFGAILRVYDSECDYVRHRVANFANAPLGSVALWNDDEERTFADVRALVEELDI